METASETVKAEKLDMEFECSSSTLGNVMFIADINFDSPCMISHFVKSVASNGQMSQTYQQLIMKYSVVFYPARR